MGELGASQHEALAKATFNATWDLIDDPDRDAEGTDRMIESAHASAYHWRQVGLPVNAARAQWLLARVYAIAGHGALARHHGANSVAICEANAIGDFDIVFAHEAVARGAAVAGDQDAARRALAVALELLGAVDDPEDRAIVQADLDSVGALLD
jgi:hypothetical protein